MTAQDDNRWMKAAIARAKRGVGRVSPEPAVGALVVVAGRQIAGAHRRSPDDAHPALRLPAGGTLYMTTPPSPDAAKQLERYDRVVIGTDDPRWPSRTARAMKRCKIEVVSGCLSDACVAADESFHFAVRHERPFVVLKSASTWDGRIATTRGESQWITGPEARRHGHQMRDRLDAIVVGVGTVSADDPMLTARVRGGVDPLRIVLDSRLSIAPSARLVTTAREVRTVVVTTRRAPRDKRNALVDAGVEVWTVKKHRAGVDVAAVLKRLYADGRYGVLVEGGARVAGSFVDSGLVDKVCLFLAPKMLGAGAPNVAGVGVRRLRDALRFESPVVKRVGDDLLLTAYTARVSNA